MEELLIRVKRDLKYYPNQKLNLYKELDEIMPKIYKTVDSNKQISTIYKTYLKDKNLYREFYFALYQKNLN